MCSCPAVSRKRFCCTQPPSAVGRENVDGSSGMEFLMFADVDI